MKLIERYFRSGLDEERVFAENVGSTWLRDLLAHSWYVYVRKSLEDTGRNLDSWSLRYPGVLSSEGFGRVLYFEGEGENYELYALPDSYEIEETCEGA